MMLNLHGSGPIPEKINVPVRSVVTLVVEVLVDHVSSSDESWSFAGGLSDCEVKSVRSENKGVDPYLESALEELGSRSTRVPQRSMGTLG
jgi:hypothetical protein